jgi:hypothetical protein
VPYIHSQFNDFDLDTMSTSDNPKAEWDGKTVLLSITDHVPISGPDAALVKELWEEQEGRERRSTTPADPSPSVQALAKKRRDQVKDQVKYLDVPPAPHPKRPKVTGTPKPGPPAKNEPVFYLSTLPDDQIEYQDDIKPLPKATFDAFATATPTPSSPAARMQKFLKAAARKWTPGPSSIAPAPSTTPSAGRVEPASLSSSDQVLESGLLLDIPTIEPEKLRVDFKRGRRLLVRAELPAEHLQFMNNVCEIVRAENDGAIRYKAGSDTGAERYQLAAVAMTVFSSAAQSGFEGRRVVDPSFWRWGEGLLASKVDTHHLLGLLDHYDEG